MLRPLKNRFEIKSGGLLSLAEDFERNHGFFIVDKDSTDCRLFIFGISDKERADYICNALNEYDKNKKIKKLIDIVEQENTFQGDVKS